MLNLWGGGEGGAINQLEGYQIKPKYPEKNLLESGEPTNLTHPWCRVTLVEDEATVNNSSVPTHSLTNLGLLLRNSVPFSVTLSLLHPDCKCCLFFSSHTALFCVQCRYFSIDIPYSRFSHDVTATMLMVTIKEAAAVLVSRPNPSGIEVYSFANVLFCFS